MLTNESNSETIFTNKRFEDMNDNEINSQNEPKQHQQPIQENTLPAVFRLQDCTEKNKTTLVNNINYLSSQFSGGGEIKNNEDSTSFEELTSNMLNNSLLDHPRQSSILASTSNDDKDDISLSFSNLSINESNEKFWSGLDTSSTNEDYSNQPYADSLNQTTLPFSEQSLVHKIQVQPNQMNLKLSMNANNYGSVRSPLNRPLLVSQNSSLYNNNNLNKTSNLNWPRSPQVQTSLHSNGLTWSNAFTSTFPSVTSCLNSYTSTSNITSSPNAWSSALYNHQQKRNQLPNQNNCTNSTTNPNNKKPFFQNENQFITEANQKFRRSANNMLTPSMKNFSVSSLSGQSNIYELGSAGSDNTSSSSDSANLRENGLFFHDKSFEQNPVLDSIRSNALEPQLCDVLKSSQEANKSMYSYPCQQTTLQDDKKHLKGRFNRRRGIWDEFYHKNDRKSPFFTGNDAESLFNEFPMSNNDPNERYSRKVFVGGLPPDIDEEEITASFRRFGHLVVDWPHKAESKSYFPPKGYAFLLFQEESSVQMLIDSCIQEEDKLYLCVSSPTMKDKPVQIRPWRLSDADYVLDASMPLDPRKTVFVGGVPRPLKAVELAMIMDRLYGGVCYAGIDTDPELKYPKGAGRVAFSNQQSYIAAISARFVQLQHADIEKRVEVKPYVLDDQICDECQGARCNGKYAPYFCANITCLQYYCENCWATIHSRPGREFHKPLVKEGADRPRAIPFRWC